MPVPEPRRPSDDRTGPLIATLVSWLTSIETWKRTGIAITLSTFALFVYLVYQHPQRVFELLRAAVARREVRALPYMTPLYSDIQRAMNTLLAEFGPDMIGITAWRIDLTTNQQQLVTAAALEEFKPTLDTLIKQRWRWPVAAFGDDPRVNHVLAQLYIGRFLCGPPPPGWPVLDRFPIAEVCLVGIPPGGIGLAGFLAGAWRKPVEPQDRPRIEATFRVAADAMVWR